jgi:phosphate transport system protein
MLSPHTVKSFDLELQRLERTIVSMGKLVAAQLADALGAITGNIPELVHDISAHDALIDDLAREVDALTLQMLALRQPLALDLRAIIAALRISIDLERIGDYAANLAKRATDLQCVPLATPIQAIVTMGHVALQMIQDSLTAYRKLDSDKAIDIWCRDHRIDQEYTILLRALHAAMLAHPDSITACTHLLFAARGIERIGDHLTNIAEHIFFLVKGVPLQQPSVQAAACGRRGNLPSRTGSGQ